MLNKREKRKKSVFQPLTQGLLSKTFAQRIGWVRRFFILILLVIVVRALQLQVIEKPKLEKRANRDWNHSISVKLRRGPIYDAEGNILAVSLPLKSVFAIPREVKDPVQAAAKLSPVLKIPSEKLIKKLDADISFTWLQRNATPSVSEAVQDLDIKGIHFLKEYQRFYPLGHHASQLVGFSGIDSQGLEGIEYRFNDHLMDNSGVTTIWNQFYGNSRLKTISGGSITLTIRSKLQHFVEKELKTAVDKMRANNGVAVVMNSNTGEILALANLPDYDPNNFDRFDSSRFFNRAVSATYEPGSTFKIITVATALNHGIVESDKIFYCEEGEYQIQDRVIHDVEKLGWLTLDKIIQKSSNICAAKIGQRIPKSMFYKSIRDFGFGSKTGIELPGEVGGTVHNYQKWSDTDTATISFGHTISATPVQIIAAINTIATDGLMIQPRIVKSALKGNGDFVDLDKPKGRQILTPEVARQMKEYMISVTQPGGTGRLAAVEGVTVAGKTGTSRKFDIRKREYSRTQHIASFAGFYPAEDPQLTILVVIDEPKEKYLYSKGAAPIFRKIAEQTLRLYPDLTQKGIKEVRASSDPRKLFTSNRLVHDVKKKALPLSSQFRNLTLREALTLADQHGVEVEITGSGRVVSVRSPKGESGKYSLILR